MGIHTRTFRTRRSHLCGLALIATLITGFTSSTPAALKVMIDPGHGGTDDGAVREGIKEAEIVLQVSRILEKLLLEDRDFKVSMTRTSNHFLTLKQRVDAAEKFGAHLFLSIHANAAHSPKAHGVEFFFQNQLPPEEEALFLATRENQQVDEKTSSTSSYSSYSPDVRAILDDLNSNHRILESYELSQFLLEQWHQPASRNSAIRQAPFYVLSQTKMPSVLVELGFVSHPTERKRLLDPQHQMQMAGSIYKALRQYREKLGKDLR